MLTGILSILMNKNKSCANVMFLCFDLLRENCDAFSTQDMNTDLLDIVM